MTSTPATTVASPTEGLTHASVDASSAGATSVRPAGLGSAWLPLTALCLAFFVEMVDNTLLTIALPTVGRALNAGTTELQWVTGAYSLTFGALLLTAGSIADRFGRRRVLFGALALFGTLSALIWFVTDIHQLIVLRACLGVAAAGMAPVTMSLVFRLYDDEATRMKAFSLMIIIGMSAMAVGPLLAGSALAVVDWHWLLFVNTPIALFAAFGVWKGIAKDDPADLHHDPLDVPAALMVMIAMGAGCYSLTSGVENGWTSPITLGCALAALVALIAFIARERRVASPMLDLALFQNRTVRGAALAQLGSSIAMMAMMFLLILHLQYALGWSPLQAGLGNLPFVVAMVVGGPIGETLMARYGHRIACTIAAVVMTASLAGLAFTAPISYWAMIAPIAFLALALRIIMTVCSVALIEAVPQDRTSLGSALNDVSQELGTSVGAAVTGTVLAILIGAGLPEGAWTDAFRHTFFTGEQVTYAVITVLVGAITIYGCSTLTDSHTSEEH